MKISSEMQGESKSFWYDNLRVIATVGVIFIHVSSDYVPAKGTIPAFDFWIGNIFDSASRFSVPIFVMLSGALLLPKEYEIGIFLKKRFARLVMPFLFWSAIYTLYSQYLKLEDGQTIGFSDTVRNIFVQYRDGSSLHLWYIYMIVGLYLFVPIIGKWVRNATEKEILYFLSIWLCTIFLNQPVFLKLKPHIELSYFTGFLGYLVLGYYLSVKKFQNIERVRLIALGMILLGLMITIFGTYYVLYSDQKYVSTFYECLSPNILLFSSGLFLFFKDKDTRNPLLVTIRNFINKYSYGIFLVHILVLRNFDDFNVRWNFINPVLGIPVTVFLCLIISTTVIFIVNKIPFGKYISG